MRLSLIDKPDCHHMTELMPGIKAVYQLEAEFEPYLIVDFVPNKDDNYKQSPGVILQAGGDTIKFDYTFDNPNDIVEMRKIIWKYVRKLHNPPDILQGGLPTFKVIQGWQNKKRMMANNKCKTCNIDCDKTKQKHDPMARKLLHEVYTLDQSGIKTKKDCNAAHSQECTDNFPSDSYDFKRCMAEVSDICDKRFSDKMLNKSVRVMCPRVPPQEVIINESIKSKSKEGICFSNYNDYTMIILAIVGIFILVYYFKTRTK